jgi:hypothetical protein
MWPEPVIVAGVPTAGRGGSSGYGRPAAYPAWAAARYLPVRPKTTREAALSILWIILIVVLVLALLGFFGRSYY